MVRSAAGDDAPAMAALLNEIIAFGGTTAFDAPFSVDRIRSTFIERPRALSCVVAADDDVPQGDGLLGFQCLDWSDPDWPGVERRPADWTFIATYVARAAQGRGVGRAMFGATRAAAISVDARGIDAIVRHENEVGLGYYRAMGFLDARRDPTAMALSFQLGPIA